MTTDTNAVAVEATVAQQAWQDGFGEVMRRVADCFPRRETRQTMREMTEAMLMDVQRVSGWTLAGALGHSGPHRLQHLLSRAVWHHGAARDRLACWAVAELAGGQAVLVADERGDEKSSTDAVGAWRQYCGALGGIGLCQVAVHLTCAADSGHALIDRAWYLARDWAGDDERRELAHVPDELCFATKPQLAAMLLERARDLGRPARWVAAGEVYGGRDLRMRIRELGYDYTMAVHSGHYVTTRAGRFTAAALTARLPRRAWQRLKTGQGGKGGRHYGWAMIEAVPDDTPPGHAAGHAFLLVRRHRYTRELSFCRCHSAAAVALGGLAAVVCRRWRIEEDFQAAKSLSGLDQGQATCWNSWMRWSLISMIAYTILAVTTAHSRAVIPASAEAKLIPLTSRELLTLLRASVLAQPRRDLAHVLHRSQWRRRHQHRAAACHRHWNQVTAAVMT